MAAISNRIFLLKLASFLICVYISFYLGWYTPRMWRTLVFHWILIAPTVQMLTGYKSLGLCGIMVFHWGSGWLKLPCAWNQMHHERSMSLVLRLTRISSWLYVQLSCLFDLAITISIPDLCSSGWCPLSNSLYWCQTWKACRPDWMLLQSRVLCPLSFGLLSLQFRTDED